MSPTRRSAPSTGGTCPSATTSPPTSATSTRATKLGDGLGALRRRAPRGHAGASCRTSPTRPPTCCATTASERGDRVAVVLPPTPETAAMFFGTWKLGAHPALDVGPLRRRRHPPSAARLAAEACSSPTPPTRARFDPSLVDEILVLDDGLLDGAPTDPRPPTPPPTTPRSSTTRRGTTGMAKGIVHAHRYMLAHEEFIYCHEVQDGERFHGMGEWAWAAGISPLLGPWRLGAVQVVLPARGRLRPAPAARLPLPPRGHERLHDPTAMRAMMAIEDAGKRYPQKFRIVCSAGEPLNPEAIRWFREQYGITVLDYYGLTEILSAVRQLPVHGGPRGLDGPADAGLGRAAPRRGRAARSPRASAARSACAPARTPTTRSATGASRRPPGDLRRRLVPHQGRRDAGRGRLRLVRRSRRRRDHRRRLPDRPVRGRVRLHRAPGGARGGRRRLARRDQGQRGQGVHRPRRGPRALRRARRARSSASCASG